MKRTRSAAMLATLALVATLTACSGNTDAAEPASSSEATTTAQSEQPTTDPATAEPTETEDARSNVDHYTIKVTDVVEGARLSVEVVDRVLDDGTVESAQDEFFRSFDVIVAGTEAPTSVQCGYRTAHVGTEAVIAEIFGHPGLSWDDYGWGDPEMDAIIDTFVFEAGPDGLPDLSGYPSSTLPNVVLTHEGVELGVCCSFG